MQNVFIDGTWNTSEDMSNVYRMYRKYGGKYYVGPGAAVNFISKYLGGIFGFGVQAIVDKAYDELNLYTGEPINIVCFSRGATAGRKLAAKLAKDGTEVAFLGCFDTVGAMGIPVNILGIPFQEINLFTDMEVHDNVIRAAHAMALNEERPAYKNTPMKSRHGINQKGFKGDHWYVGSSDETFDWMVVEFENLLI